MTMSRNTYRFALGLWSILVFILGGCESLPMPRSIPRGVNAKLPTYGGNRPLPWSVSSDSDASVLVYVDTTGEYDVTTTCGWIHHWHVCGTRRISTEQGHFDEDVLSFVYCESQGAPGARIQATRFPIPFRHRMTLLLGLKTDRKPYEIVSMEQRSWLPPYGKLTKPTEEIADFEKVIGSVLSFLQRDGASARRNSRPS